MVLAVQDAVRGLNVEVGIDQQRSAKTGPFVVTSPAQEDGDTIKRAAAPPASPPGSSAAVPARLAALPGPMSSPERLGGQL